MEEGAEQSETTWPTPEFHFKVEWGSEVLSFQEVLGLESGEIKHRKGDVNVLSKIKMPGLNTSGNITMKNGVFKGDRKFFDWLDKIKTDTIGRVPVTISLLDEGSGMVMVWRLANARPTKIASTDVLSEINGITVETIEIQYEGMMVSKS